MFKLEVFCHKSNFKAHFRICVVLVPWSKLQIEKHTRYFRVVGRPK